MEIEGYFPQGSTGKKGHYPLSDLSPCCLSSTLVSKHVLCHMVGLLMLGLPGLPLGLKGGGCGLRTCISSKFPEDADVAGLKTTLQGHVKQADVPLTVS